MVNNDAVLVAWAVFLSLIIMVLVGFMALGY